MRAAAPFKARAQLLRQNLPHPRLSLVSASNLSQKYVLGSLKFTDPAPWCFAVVSSDPPYTVSAIASGQVQDQGHRQGLGRIPGFRVRVRVRVETSTGLATSSVRKRLLSFAVASGFGLFCGCLSGEPEVSSLGPGGGAGGPGSVTSGGGGPSEAHAGPRIFVGKLTKGTTEDDVKQYFTRCAARQGSSLGL
jgi:hypothetical protein